MKIQAKEYSVSMEGVTNWKAATRAIEKLFDSKDFGISFDWPGLPYVPGLWDYDGGDKARLPDNPKVGWDVDNKASDADKQELLAGVQKIVAQHVKLGTPPPVQEIKVAFARGIGPYSWLRESRRELDWFLRGYEYASTQTCAIPSLSQLSPEEIYLVVSSVVRGARMAGLSEKMLKKC